MSDPNGHLANLAAASNGTECDDPTYAVSKYIQFFVPIVYGLPTLVLYGHIVYVIVKAVPSSTLSIAFYRLYAIMAVVTSVMWVWDMTTTRFIATGLWCHQLLAAYSTPQHLYAPLQFVMTFSRHAQFYSATAISVNRMTAVVSPIKYARIWERGPTLRIVISLIFVLPLPSTWYLGPWTKALLARYPMGGLTLTYEKLLPNPWNSVTWMTMFVGSNCALVIFVSTMLTYVKLRRLIRRSENARGSKTDVSLLIVGLVSSVTTFFLAAVEAPFYILCNYLMDNYYFFVCTNIKQVLIDIILVFSPWSMLMVCTAVRQAIFGIYLPRAQVPTITVSEKSHVVRLSSGQVRPSLVSVRS